MSPGDLLHPNLTIRQQALKMGLFSRLRQENAQLRDANQAWRHQTGLQQPAAGASCHSFDSLSRHCKLLEARQLLFSQEATD